MTATVDSGVPISCATLAPCDTSASMRCSRSKRSRASASSASRSRSAADSRAVNPAIMALLATKSIHMPARWYATASAWFSRFIGM